MKKVLVLGGQGFIGSYLCADLLEQGYEVVSIDNFSKYGKLSRPHDKHPNFTLVEGDVKHLLKELQAHFYRAERQKPNGRTWTQIKNETIYGFDYVIALAAKIGGISYFHQYAYDLFSENEQIMAQTCNFLRDHNKVKPLKRAVYISSSMVFETSMTFPTPENMIWMMHPLSSYGRQKLVVEWWAKALWEQYKVPFTIVRPFNCVGTGEEDALGEHEVSSGNVKLMMSHVLPDLINKCLKGQDPLHILGDGDQVRHYTNGKDIARGIRLAMESDKAINNDYNISTPEGTSVLELAQKVWTKINPNKPFKFVSDQAYEHDVQMRVPDVSKAERELGFKAEISLDQSIDEVITYMRKKMK